eukprot:2594130-Pleurochrysis_carterae.AAC.1
MSPQSVAAVFPTLPRPDLAHTHTQIRTRTPIDPPESHSASPCAGPASVHAQGRTRPLHSHAPLARAHVIATPPPHTYEQHTLGPLFARLLCAHTHTTAQNTTPPPRPPPNP